MNIEVGTKLYGVETSRFYKVDFILRKGTHAVIEDEIGTVMLKTISEIEKSFINVSQLEELRKQKFASEEPKNNEVVNPVKWHEALLMAASGTPMHCGNDTNCYIKIDPVTKMLAWFDKRTNTKNCILEVWQHDHWVNEWYPYTPKKMVVDWTKVPVDTDVFIRQFEYETRHKRKFKAFVGNKVFVESAKENYLCSWPFTELAEPNDDYMKEAE